MALGPGTLATLLINLTLPGPGNTISEAETKEGLAILDEVLTEVDRYYEG